MVKLNQVLAIEKGEKNRAFKALSDLHHKSQKEPLYDGRIRTYRPVDDDGEKLPTEKQLVQVRAEDVLASQADILTGLWDIVASKDWANAKNARCDLVVDNEILLANVPVTYLLFLEKQLTDIETFISKIPTLDPSEEWEYTQSQNCYVTRPSMSNRTKKVLRNHVKAEATAHHPAQVETYMEDVVIGHYETIRHSGALPVQRKSALLERVRKLRACVLAAREEANAVDVEKIQAGAQIFGYLLG